MSEQIITCGYPAHFTDSGAVLEADPNHEEDEQK